MAEHPIVLVAGAVLSGRELEPVERGIVVMEGGSITAVGPSEGFAQPPGATIVRAPQLTLLPGFIDCHVHIGLVDPLEVVFGGVTTVRDLGWPPGRIHPLARASKDPGFKGPRILAAGPILTAPGGYPSRAAWAPDETARIVTGPEDAEAAVELTASEGARVVKVALDDEAGPTLSPETLAAVVEGAHRRGLEVTGHVHGLTQLAKALGAGLDELAHMLMGAHVAPPRTIARMVAAGVSVVPTLSIRSGAELDVATDNLARFDAAGGAILYGTDLGNEGPRPGIDECEVAAMARAGLSGRRIIESATVDAARHLGLERAGVLEAGRDADIVGVEGDPLSDPLALTRVGMVWRGGREVRSEGVESPG